MIPSHEIESGVPAALAPRSRKIVIEDYALNVDIGFHDFEVGRPQRLLVTIEVWVDAAFFPTDDEVDHAWNYDGVHSAVAALVGRRRYNLQETIAREIYDLVAARTGVLALRVSTRKPDIYSDCVGVGVDIASF